MRKYALNDTVTQKRASHAKATIFCLIAIVSTDALAAGFRPFARDDEASVPRGGSVSELITGATSVLANDFDIERDSLTARLETDVKHGTLTLNADGTFFYVHHGGNDKDDKFRYVAFDGTRESRSADVLIKMTADVPPDSSQPPVITGQDDLSTVEDTALVIKLRDLTVEDPDSNYPKDFTLFVQAGENYDVTGTTIVPAADFNGSLSVPVTVSDGQTLSPVFNLLITVTPGNDAPFILSPVADQVTVEGELFELDLAAHFGDIDAGDILTFASAGLPPSGTISLDSVTGMMAGTPQLTDALDVPYQVVVTAEDTSGSAAVLAFRLTIAVLDRPDLAVNVKVQPNLVTFRDSPLWEIQVQNLGPGQLGEGLLEAEWFSSEAPVSLSFAENCDVFGNDTTRPSVQCLLTDLPAEAMATITIQSTHLAPGDSNIRAFVNTDDPRPENNAAGLSLNLPASFSEGPTQFLSASGEGIAGGDLNLDGHTDLVITAGETLVFFNDGQRRLITPGLSLGSESGGTSVALLDWNLDGAPEIAIASGGSTPDKLYLNDGQSGFSTAIDLPTSQTSVVIASDLDQDGVEELILSGLQGTFIVRNDGQGIPVATPLHSSAARHLSGGDLSGDGLPDLVITDADTRAVYVLANDGNGATFSEQIFNYGSVAGVTLHDVDLDGALDLLLAIDGADLSVPQNRVLRNLQTGEFSDWAFVGASPTTEFLAGDVNRDGNPDLVTINETGVHQIFLGDGTSVFNLADEHILSLGIFRGSLIDINGDESLDLILAGKNSNRVDVHANDGLGKFGPGDITPPILNLLGAPSMTMDAGDGFQDPGATASDDIDGDLTTAIEVAGTVSTTIIGSYTITYAVSDRSGNLIQATRVVSVEPRTEGGGGGGNTDLFILIYLTVLAIWRRRVDTRSAGAFIRT